MSAGVAGDVLLSLLDLAEEKEIDPISLVENEFLQQSTSCFFNNGIHSAVVENRKSFRFGRAN